PIGDLTAKYLEISAIAIAAGDSDIVWVGHVNGAVFHTNNATATAPTWRQVTSAAFPSARYCSRITVHPTDNNLLYVPFAAPPPRTRPSSTGRSPRPPGRTSGPPRTAASPGGPCPRRCPRRRSARSPCPPAGPTSSTPEPRSACTPANTAGPPGRRRIKDPRT